MDGLVVALDSSVQTLLLPVDNNSLTDDDHCRFCVLSYPCYSNELEAVDATMVVAATWEVAHPQCAIVILKDDDDRGCVTFHYYLAYAQAVQ